MTARPDLAEIERLPGLLESETACDPDCHGRCRRCPDDLMRRAAGSIRSLITRVRVLETALSNALEAAQKDGLHGGKYHDNQCPVCELIANAHVALGESSHD